MPPEIARWLPLVCVLGCCFWLWSAAQPDILPEVRNEHAVALAVPKPARDYAAPADLRSPFLSPERLGEAPPPQKKTAGHAPGPTVARVAVDGIFWDAVEPLASINGTTLRPGESVGRVRLLSILPDRVTVAVDGKQRVILLNTAYNFPEGGFALSRRAAGARAKTAAGRTVSDAPGAPKKSSSDEDNDNEGSEETP